ncbi:MAG: bifunctional glycosyltransferase family 2/GtrA family protein [Solirubrobacterales bacterium]
MPLPETTTTIIETSAEAPLASVEIVVPVYNEARALADSIRKLDTYLSDEFPLSYSITIADNASRDDTPLIGRALADDLDSVNYLRLEEKGRGRALRTAWLASKSPVACYMDVDLSTDLKALLPLVAPLLSGHSDVAIGSRLAPGSNVVRGPKREFISRSYNSLLRTILRSRFTDAQCGFKAVRTDAARELLADVKDQGWFFDTELLVSAERHGLRIHEVPVDWVDDPDSRVDIINTAWLDLKGVARLFASSRIARFAIVGVVSTIAYAVLYLMLRSPLGPDGANALALGITAIANTAANRRWTFGLRGPERLFRQYAMGGLVYLLTLGVTSAAMAVLYGLDPFPSRPLEVSVLVLASITATITRYVALKSWVFAIRFPNRADRQQETG